MARFSKLINTFLPAILIVGFIGITAVGFAAFNCKMADAGNNCISAILNNTDCPLDAAGFALHHIFTFKTFSNLLSSQILDSAVMLLTLALFFIIFITNEAFSPKLVLLIRHLTDPTKRVQNGQEKFMHWLTLLEHSPDILA